MRGIFSLEEDHNNYLKIDPYHEFKKIKQADMAWYEVCQKHWDNLTKPLNSLGLLEDAISRIGAIQEREDVKINRKIIVSMCADNGIIEEGVTQADHTITSLVTEHMASGIANVNIMSRYSGTDVCTVDIGLKEQVNHPLIWDYHIADGTRNFLKGPAMSMEETEVAIAAGIDIASRLKKYGYQIIGLGEMGIGNTTTSSALCAKFLNLSPETVTGPGAGLSSEGIARKVEVIRKGLEKYHDVTEPLKVLSCLGGLDIAGLVGVMAGAAVNHMPVVLDGYISYAAAITAVRICPEIRSYLLASHISSEPASMSMVQDLGLKPIIHAEMSLGEGTGAAAYFPLLDMALSIYNFNMTFEDSGMDAYEHLE